MTRLIPSLSAITIWLLANTLFAEQIVVTKSGTTLVGTVTFDGDAVIVEIAKGNLRVPLSEVVAVATIATEGGVAAQGPTQAQSLLLKAAEARLLKNGGEEAAGILAEAARLAPDDPRIAFWYAGALVDAGEGKAANDVVNRHREAISAAYPNMLNTLTARIEQRLKLESLPRELMNRIDRLNAFAESQPPTGGDQQLFAAFRVVDQHQTALPAGFFRVECNGHDDKLEAFDDGHFLLVFKQNRGSEGGPCKLTIAEPGYESRTFEFAASPSEVKNAGEFVVKKYEESARRRVQMHVMDGEGEPISGAEVRLNPQLSRNSSEDDSLSADTDDSGNVEILAYPLEYLYRVTANGMNPEQGMLTVKEASDVPETKVTLYAALEGSLRVKWIRKIAGEVGESTTGEATVEIPAVQRGFNPVDFRTRGLAEARASQRPVGAAREHRDVWLRFSRARQYDSMGRNRQGRTGRRSRPGSNRQSGSSALDLNKIDELKKEYPQADEADFAPVRGPAD